MFNCAVCREAIGPRIKPINIVTEVASKEYHNEFFTEDELGNRELHKVDSVGKEIMTEIKICQKDAEILFGEKFPEPKLLTSKPSVRNQELQAATFKTALAAVVVHNALERLNHRSKRAKADGMLVVPMIKSFVDANPKFIF